MIGSITIKPRPVRLACLVDPHETAQVRDAIRLNSSLWGGVSFPIVPVYKRQLPKTWAEKPFRRPRLNEVIQGYIDAFDPDLLVQFPAQIPNSFANIGIKAIRPEEIWATLQTGRTLSPQIGIGVFEVLGDIFQEHFRYRQKYPVRVILPQIPKQHALFWASIFGELPPELLSVLNAHYREPLEIAEPEVAVEKLPELLGREVLFPRRLTQYGLTPGGRVSFFREARVYYLDATKTEDIIDFWNLRALGPSVLALPKQHANDPVMRNLLVDFLKAHRRPLPSNPNAFDHASIIRSRNSTIEELQELGNRLVAEQDGAGDTMFSLRRSYPRIWDEWGRGKDGAQPQPFYGDNQQSIDLSESSDRRVRIRPVRPSFAEKFPLHDGPQCANDIEFRLYRSSDFIAEVLPKSSGQYIPQPIAGLASLNDEWRVDHNGLVRFVNSDLSVWRDIPVAEEVMFAWLADRRWKSSISTAGILAKQIYRQLEGNLFPLRHEKLLGLLEFMNGGAVRKDGSPADNHRVVPELQRDLYVGEAENRLTTKHGTLHDFLVSKEVFRLGSKIQCPECMRGSWFPLQAIRESLICPKCLKTFPAIGNLTKGAWSYKTAGPFSVPAYADGAYAVLLTVDFFSDRRLGTLRTTPILSFKARADGKPELEADFASLWQESVFGERNDGVIFGECKTYGEFKKKDFDRIRQLAREFPGAILVFSTLRKTLAPREIRQISRIAKNGRKYWKADRPINPILILTGTELLEGHPPPYCWNDPLRKRFQHIHGLLKLCDATQQIYLGLPSWHTDWHDQWERRRRRMSERLCSTN